MANTHESEKMQHAILHFKVRSSALKVNRETKTFDSVQEFCDRINKLQSKSDGELSRMGLERSEVGAHVLQRLLN